MGIKTFDEACAAALRGDISLWPAGASESLALEDLTRRLHYHGIAGLLYERRNRLEGWPAELLEMMRSESLARTMWELRHKALLSELIAELSDAGIVTVVLKGTAYAYSVYERPALRFRGDTDLLVEKAALRDARRVLDGRGWFRPYGAPGRFGELHYQEVWQIVDPAGLSHDIDLHWEVTNSRALRSVLDADEVIATSVPLNNLIQQARMADAVTSLIHRAVNRAVHVQSGYYSIDRQEYDANRLLWAKDLDLLARRLSSSDWDELRIRARSSGVSSVLAEALGFAQQSLQTPVPCCVRGSLANASTATPTARFLSATTTSFDLVLADFVATPGIGARLRFLLTHAFPSADHMRRKYPAHKSSPVWLLYIRRIFEALARVLGKEGV